MKVPEHLKLKIIGISELIPTVQVRLKIVGLIIPIWNEKEMSHIQCNSGIYDIPKSFVISALQEQRGSKEASYCNRYHTEEVFSFPVRCCAILGSRPPGFYLREAELLAKLWGYRGNKDETALFLIKKFGADSVVLKDNQIFFEKKKRNRRY